MYARRRLIACNPLNLLHSIFIFSLYSFHLKVAFHSDFKPTCDCVCLFSFISIFLQWFFTIYENLLSHLCVFLLFVCVWVWVYKSVWHHWRFISKRSNKRTITKVKQIKIWKSLDLLMLFQQASRMNSQTGINYWR